MSGDKQIQKPDMSKRTGITNVSQGIEIVRTGKPVAGSPKTGYVYLLVDCSVSMRGDKISQAKKRCAEFCQKCIGKRLCHRVNSVRFLAKAFMRTRYKFIGFG